MAANKTNNYGLNQWSKTDPVRMEDFNADNAKLDAALTQLRQNVNTVMSTRIVAGTYTGNGSPSQTISLGFTPIAVLVCKNGDTFDYRPGTTILAYGGLVVTGKNSNTISITTNGFTVYYDRSGTYEYYMTNEPDTEFTYLAIG